MIHEKSTVLLFIYFMARKDNQSTETPLFSRISLLRALLSSDVFGLCRLALRRAHQITRRHAE